MSDAAKWQLMVFHIRENLQKIKRYTSGMSQISFSKDDKTVDAVVRCFQVIGEAAKKVPDDVRKQYPSVPWREMAGLRDVLVHDYDVVDLSILYKVIEEKIPELEEKIRQIPVSEEDIQP